jgi:hypothetical protein
VKEMQEKEVIKEGMDAVKTILYESDIKHNIEPKPESMMAQKRREQIKTREVAAKTKWLILWDTLLAFLMWAKGPVSYIVKAGGRVLFACFMLLKSSGPKFIVSSALVIKETGDLGLAGLSFTAIAKAGIEFEKGNYGAAFFFLAVGIALAIWKTKMPESTTTQWVKKPLTEQVVDIKRTAEEVKKTFSGKGA